MLSGGVFSIYFEEDNPNPTLNCEYELGDTPKWKNTGELQLQKVT